MQLIAGVNIHAHNQDKVAAWSNDKNNEEKIKAKLNVTKTLKK